MKKKKLLLHFGYPKTATTTLQEEVFVKLHEMGRINYLGRTIKSTDKLYGKCTFRGDDLVPNIRRSLTLNQPQNIDLSKLSTEKINVISDENLTLHGYFNLCRFGIKNDPLLYPNKIKACLGDDVDVSLMVTIRNQTDLIFSSFIQMYRFIYNSKDKLSFEKFIFQHDADEVDLNFLRIYDSNKVVNNYINTFKANCEVFFFEDVKNDLNSFCTKLAELLPATSTEIEAFFGSKHYRKKKTEGSQVLVSINERNKLFIFLSKFVDKSKLQYYLEKRYYYKLGPLLRLEKAIFKKGNGKNQKVKIPLPSDDQRKLLTLAFQESNLSLANRFDLDIEKMYRYGYIYEVQQ